MAWIRSRLSALSSTTASVVMRSGDGSDPDGVELPAGDGQIGLDALNMGGTGIQLAATRQLFAGNARMMHRDGAQLSRAGFQPMERGPQRGGIAAIQSLSGFGSLVGSVFQEQLDHAAQQLLSTKAPQPLERRAIEHGG